MTRTLTGGKDAALSVQLRESAFSNPGSLTVDRENGVIRGVKIAGIESPNTHNMPGATKGTRYSQAVFDRALHLYEGALSDKNHNVAANGNPHDSNPDQRIGWFTNVRTTPDGIFGDYNVLKSDPLAAKLFEAAERNPRLFAMSHNSYGKGNVVDGWFVISEILSVDSIDLVKDGGTTHSLIESRKRPTMKKTFRQLLLESKNPSVQAFAKKSHVARLLEMDGLGDSVLDTPEPAAEDAAKGWKEQLGELFKTLVMTEEMDPADLKKKLNSALKLLEEGGKDEGDASINLDESGDDKDAPPPKKEGDDKDKKDDDEKETKESLKRENAKLKDLATCRKLCESEGFMSATQGDIERIQKMDSADDRKWLIATLKTGKTPAKATQSQAPGVQIKESKTTPAAAEPFAPLLRG